MADYLKNLSKDLINDVRKIMEAKKTNKHGHDPVGKEDADIDNDGDVDKSDSYLHNRRKAIAKNMKKEEVEPIDELSKKTLGSYVSKASMSAADKGAEFGRKKAEADEMDRVMNRHMSFSDKDKVRQVMKTTTRDVEKPREKANRRLVGIDRAVKRLTKEEVQIDEALNAGDRYGHHHTAIKSLLKSITQHVDSHKNDAHKHKDHTGKKGVHWGHVGDLAHVHSQLADIHDSLARQGEYKKSMRESVELTDEEFEYIDELSKKTLSNYAYKAAKEIGDHGVTAGLKIQNSEPAGKDLRKMAQRMRGVGIAANKLAKEEYEELDEAPVDGVAAGSMAGDGHLCATKVFHKEWAEGTPIFSQHAEPDANGDIAWYDVMFEHGIEKMVPTDEMEILMSETHERHGKRKMKEEAELDEARGRPRKNPLPAGQQSDEPEPRQHIMQQLQRAKLSMHGSAPIKFKDGTTHEVHGKHAAHLLGKYSDMKPYEKEAFQKKIGHSHANLKSEL